MLASTKYSNFEGLFRTAHGSESLVWSDRAARQLAQVKVASTKQKDARVRAMPTIAR